MPGTASERYAGRCLVLQADEFGQPLLLGIVPVQGVVAFEDLVALIRVLDE